jgi:hypothetical protein
MQWACNSLQTAPHSPHIAGTLELFHLGLLWFQRCTGETTGHPVAVYQHIDQRDRSCRWMTVCSTTPTR